MGFWAWLVIVIVFWGIIPAVRERKRREQMEALHRVARTRIVTGLAGMLAKMAKADGHVSREEVELAKQFLLSMGLSDDEYQKAVSTFNAARDDGRDIGHYARIFCSEVSDEARQLVYEMLWGIAGADGRLDPGEDRLLLEAAFALGFDQAIYAYYRRLHVGSGSSGGYSGNPGGQPRRDSGAALEQAYSRLGCSASDSDETVRAAYRRQAMKYHPDRLRAEGLPEGMLEQATKTMAEINAAWDTVRAARGMS